MEQQNPYETPTGNLATEGDPYGEINFFSPGARIGRVRYLSHGMLVALVFYVVLAVLMFLGMGMNLNGGGGGLGFAWLLVIPAYIFIIYCSVLFMVQRLHDLNQTGWWWLLSFIPLVNIVFILWIVFAPGTPGANDYGLRPPPNKTWNWILAVVGPVLFVVGILAAIAIPAYHDYMERAEAAQQSQSE